MTSHTETIIAALRVLARDIQSNDGIANAAIAEAADRLQEQQKQIDELRKAVAKQNENISQTCGKALGYPWFKDDQKNFPGATEACGVCFGEHVAETIVTELAKEYAKALERIKRLEEVAAKLANCARFLGTWSHDETNVLRMKDEAMDELQKLEETKP